MTYRTDLDHPLLTDIRPNAGPTPILGTGKGDRHLQGTATSDIIRGLGGNDWIHALAGNDTIDGGAGSDKLYGGGGKDTFILGQGADSIYGGSGSDVLDASKLTAGVTINVSSSSQGFPHVLANSITLGTGEVQAAFGIENFIGSDFDDVFYAANINSTQHGGDGNDKLQGGFANAVLYGENGNDILTGVDHDNRLYGGEGNDTIFGGIGTAQIYGGNGNDNISVGYDLSFPLQSAFGGAGDDTIHIHDNNTKVYGGGGADTFEFSNSGGTVQDFALNLDVIDMRVFFEDEPHAITFDELMTFAKFTGGNTVITVDTVTKHGFTFTLVGVDPDNLTAHDFLLS